METVLAMHTELKTNSATTKDWLKASENMQITAYDPSAATEPEAFTRQDFERDLKRASRRITPAKPHRHK